VILGYDGREVADTQSLRNEVAATSPGTTVKIDLVRDGKIETVTATISRLEAEAAIEAEPSKEGKLALAKFGLTVQTLTPELAKQLDIQTAGGVVITLVEEGSVASLANLQPGDVILEAGHQKVSTVEELEQALAKVKDKGSVLLLVNHGGTPVFVVLGTS
jgi:serine protease Do